VNIATAQAIIGAFEPTYRVTDVLVRTGGEVSHVYEIRGAGAQRPLIVKAYPPRWRPKLIKEVYVYRLLSRHGIREIPRVLHAAPYGVPEYPLAHTVMTRLPGRPLAQVRGDVARVDLDNAYARMGAWLAAVHGIALECWGYLTTRVVDRKSTNVAYMTDQFARRLSAFRAAGGDPHLARVIERHVDRHAGAFAGCLAPVLCHNDFHEGNVIVDNSSGRWRVSGYVDVEGAVAADAVFDLARTDYHALRGDPARREAFLRGYGRLPPDWADRAALYQLHHALELWRWSADHGRDTSPAQADLEALADCQHLR
jgi:aminoglycoside phosphotransferase (APT) family kinase protein